MRLVFFFLALLIMASPAMAAPRILVSIKPIHALISGVTEGVTEPELLIQKNISPHTYSLKPSDAKKIRQADVIFFVSPELETFLPKLLKDKSKAIELMKVEGITSLAAREYHFWGEAADEEEKEGHHGHHHDDGQDPHIWLDVGNAITIVSVAAEVLSRKDPAHQAQYMANAKKMTGELQQLDEELKQRLAPYSAVPYLVFHDAYQYFEKRYHLNSLGAVVLNPNKEPGAKTMRELQEVASKNHVVCLFAEPQFPAAIVERIAEETGIGTGILDAEWGADVTGKEAYFTLMRNLGKSITECVDKKRSLMS